MAFPAAVTSMFSSVLRWAATARPVAGMLLLILVSLFSTVKLTKPMEQFVSRFAGVTEIVPDGVTLSERRFVSLRALLPRHGTVGYVTDDDMGGYAAYEKYLVVRYVLSPVLVENGPQYALVVGNITQPATDLDRFLRKHNLTLLKNLGDGVLLLEDTSR